MEHSLTHADFGQIRNISRDLVYIEIFLPAQFGDKRPTDGAESQRRQTDCELWREAGDTATRGPPIVLLGVRHPCQDTACSCCGPEVLQTRSHFKTGQGLVLTAYTLFTLSLTRPSPKLSSPVWPWPGEPSNLHWLGKPCIVGEISHLHLA